VRTSGLGQDARRRSARNTSFEISQFLPATGDGCVGGGQEHSELRSNQQVTLNLQGQPRELGAISQSGQRLVVTSWYALFTIAHWCDIFGKSRS
jgi:hypothetical protein